MAKQKAINQFAYFDYDEDNIRFEQDYFIEQLRVSDFYLKSKVEAY